MPVFVFEALDSQGKEFTSEIEAPSTEEATKKIRGMGYIPTNVRLKKEKAKKAGPARRGKKKTTLAFGKVKTKHLTTFTRQLATLQDAGLPIVRSLRILEEQQKPGVLKNALIEVAEDVEGGMTLSQAMEKHPKVFDRLYTNMVKAGETGGVLDTILERLAVFMEKAQKIKKQVISSMIYPAAVISVAGLILALIMTFIVPKFKAMFEDMGVTLPMLTQLLITVSNILKDYWYLLPGVPFGFYVLYRLICLSKAGRYALDYAKMKLPIFGQIISKSTVSRFARTFGTLLASGVPILDALSIVRQATGNAVFERALNKLHDAIREGENIAPPLAATGVCDHMVTSMIEVGEETGELDKMLVKIADTYDEDVDALVGGMMSLIEPLLIVGLGMAVGFIVVSLFLPLVTLMSSLSG